MKSFAHLPHKNAAKAGPKAQGGLSLIELMIALLISSLLLLGVLELFGSSSQTQRSANAVARLQENGRLVMDLIAREARRTGFYGCDGGLADSEEVDFKNQGGGKIKFPDESLTFSGDTSLTFRYYASKAPDQPITAGNCKKADLEPRWITFKNDGKHLRVNNQEAYATNGEILLNHANITQVRYIQPCHGDENKSCTYKAKDLPGNSFAGVKKLEIELKLCTDTLSESSPDYCSAGSTSKIERTFRSTIELRNRQ